MHREAARLLQALLVRSEARGLAAAHLVRARVRVRLGVRASVRVGVRVRARIRAWLGLGLE